MQVEASRGKQFCQGFLYSSSDNPLDSRYYKATILEAVIGVSSGVLSVKNPLYGLGLILSLAPIAKKIKAIPLELNGWQRIGKGSSIFLMSTVISATTFACSGFITHLYTNQN